MNPLPLVLTGSATMLMAVTDPASIATLLVAVSLLLTSLVTAYATIRGLKQGQANSQQLGNVALNVDGNLSELKKQIADLLTLQNLRADETVAATLKASDQAAAAAAAAAAGGTKGHEGQDGSLPSR